MAPVFRSRARAFRSSPPPITLKRKKDVTTAPTPCSPVRHDSVAAPPVSITGPPTFTTPPELVNLSSLSATAVSASSSKREVSIRTENQNSHYSLSGGTLRDSIDRVCDKYSLKFPEECERWRKKILEITGNLQSNLSPMREEQGSKSPGSSEESARHEAEMEVAFTGYATDDTNGNIPSKSNSSDYDMMIDSDFDGSYPSRDRHANKDSLESFDLTLSNDINLVSEHERMDGGILESSFGNQNRMERELHPLKIPKGNKLSKMAALKQPYTDNYLIRDYAILASKADKLDLSQTILDRAKEIYKKADRNLCKRRKKDVLTAACLFLTCQDEGFPCGRTLKKISSASGYNMKTVNKMKEQLKKEIGHGKFVRAKDLTFRSCSEVGMEYKEMKAVNETLEKLKEFDIRRSPKSILAAVMYMVVQVSNGVPGLKGPDSLSLEKLSQAADVAVGTTKKTYKDLYPYASRILPTWFANLEDIKKLPGHRSQKCP